MKLFDKMKELVLGSEEIDEGFGGVQEEEYEEPVVHQNVRHDPIESFESVQSYEPRKAERAPERSKVVDFSAATQSRASAQKNAGDRPHVVVAKLDSFEDVREIAKNINEKRMVIINLENADNSTTQRIIDFIYGVTFANSSELKRVAFRTYVIKPAGYDYTGGDGFDSNNMDGIVFGNN